MKSFKSALVMFSLLCLMGVLTLPLTSCREEGPAERTGRALDDAGQDARDAADDLTDNFN